MDLVTRACSAAGITESHLRTRLEEVNACCRRIGCPQIILGPGQTLFDYCLAWDEPTLDAIHLAKAFENFRLTSFNWLPRVQVVEQPRDDPPTKGASKGATAQAGPNSPSTAQSSSAAVAKATALAAPSNVVAERTQQALQAWGKAEDKGHKGKSDKGGKKGGKKGKGKGKKSSSPGPAARAQNDSLVYF